MSSRSDRGQGDGAAGTARRELDASNALVVLSTIPDAPRRRTAGRVDDDSSSIGLSRGGPLCELRSPTCSDICVACQLIL